MANSKKNYERIYRLLFGDVYPMYIRKAEKKGRSKEEVDDIIVWLTGYDKKGITRQIKAGTDMEKFFKESPRFNPKASKITGVICGYRVEEIKDKLIQKVRFLDKLIDELAKGRPMEKILRT